MSSIERDVARHYTHGGLEGAILSGLHAMGRDQGSLRPEDLASIEEFHLGGRQATEELAEQMALAPGMALLDIGSGIGGTARFLARRYGCTVSGLDLTPEYVAVAEALSRMVGLSDRVGFRVGSATDLPFAAAAFDAATLLHVGMNIPEKERLFAEVSRVLRPGGVFGLYDIMRTGEGDLRFPVPWAATAGTSFVAEPEVYRQGLQAAGFEVTAERNRGDFAIEFFRTIRRRFAESGPPPLGLHVLMGATAPEKVANTLAALEQGILAPVEMVSRRRR